MTERPAAADHPPLSDPARDPWLGNAVTATVVTRLGARLAIADAAERATQPGGGLGG
jgi:hypothetical protein